MNYVDLHVHSNASDGTLRPEEVVPVCSIETVKSHGFNPTMTPLPGSPRLKRLQRSAGSS